MKEIFKSCGKTGWNPVRNKGLLCVLSVFVLSRILFYLAGVRFNSSPLEVFWQFIDPVLLRTRLLESLYYLHSQPPLFNLYLGVALKFFTPVQEAFFAVSYLFFGIVIAVSLYRTLEWIGTGQAAAAVLSSIFMVSPPVILYENYLTYEYVVVAQLCLAAWLLARFMETGKPVYCAAFFGVLTAIIWTRSLFHLLWFFAAAGTVLILHLRRWKTLLACLALPALLACLLYAKNFALFGSFSASSWAGMNLASLTTARLEGDSRDALIRSGKLSPLAAIPGFKPAAAYEEFLTEASPFNVPVLTEPFKKNGSHNFNHYVYAHFSQQYMKDAAAIIKARPDLYGANVLKAAWFYFLPSCEDRIRKVDLNRERIILWDRLYHRFLYGAFFEIDIGEIPREERTPAFMLAHSAFGIIALFGTALCGGFWLILRRAPSSIAKEEGKAAVLGFIWITLVYVSLVGSLFELGENNRFRFLVEPYATLIVGALWARWRTSLCLRDGSVCGPLHNAGASKAGS